MTNDVVGAAADVVASVGDQACSVLGQEFSRGQEFVEQIWAWLMDKGVEFLAHVVAALLILFVGGFFVKLITALVRKALRKSRRVNELLEAFLCSVVSKTGWIFLAVIALGKIGVDVGPLVAGLGVTGFVLGFAFKDTLSNFASGIMIALNQPFRVGDYVIVAGVEGAVMELNMMATVLTTPDNKKIVVPNSSVWGGPVTNFSALGRRRVDLQGGVAYGTDLKKAMAIAREALKTVPEVLQEPAPAVAVASLDDSAVVINVRPWSTCADYWTVYSEAQVAITEAFEKAGIEIPFPQLTVHMDK